jgi:preprotein translocase subunit SecB
MQVKLDPNGEFSPSKSEFLLTLHFKCFELQDLGINETIEEKKLLIESTIVGKFAFVGVKDVDSIPDFFYTNALAILFPYLRSFISTLTLQANSSNAVILPLYNLLNLVQPLRENTTLDE